MATKDESILFASMHVTDFIPIGLGAMTFMEIFKNVTRDPMTSLVVSSVALLAGAASARAMLWWGRVVVEANIAVGTTQTAAKIGVYFAITLIFMAAYIALAAFVHGRA